MADTIIATYEEWLAQEKMPAGKKKALLAGLSLFAQQGFNGTSTAQLAETAGVSQATIFKYFKTKDDLLSEIIMPIMPQIFQNFFPHLAGLQTLEETVSFIVHDRFQFFAGNQAVLKIVIQEAMINQRLRQDMVSRIMSQDIGQQMLGYLEELKVRFPHLNQELTPLEIIRSFIGPLLAYFAQCFIIEVPKANQAHDLDLISQQILASLTI